jgi:tetratricopeptide (TPR) repeat protein
LAAPLLESTSTRSESCQLQRDALVILARTVTPENAQRLTTLDNLGQCLMMKKEFGAAREQYDELLRLAKAQSSSRAHAELGLGLVLLNSHEHAEAEHHLRRSVADYLKVLGPTDRMTYRSRLHLAHGLFQAGNFQGALQEATGLLGEFARANIEPPDSEAATLKGTALVELHKPAEAKAAFEASLAWVTKRKRTEEEDLTRPYLGLGRAERALGQLGPAVAHLEKVVELTPVEDNEPEDRAEVVLELARALADAHEWQRACTLGREAAAGYARAGALFDDELRKARAFLDQHRRRCGRELRRS